MVKAKRHLSDYLQVVTANRWQRAKHLIHLCEHLEAVAAGNLTRLMVFMPPRHGKSECASRGFPAWYLSNYPNNEVILTSYGADLAEDMSRWARDYFTMSGNLFGLQLSKRSQAADHWTIRGKSGGLVAAGVGGPISGRGGNVVIVDDPVKNMEEARSRTTQEHIYEWFLAVVKTRLAPGGSIVIVMTRWDRMDLAGRLLKDAEGGRGDPWKVITFPAIAHGADILGREAGDVLWPERYPLKEIQERRDTMPPFMWSALYQQNPTLDARTVLWNQELLDRTRINYEPETELRAIGVDVGVKSKRRSHETGIIAAARDTLDHGYVLADRSGVYTPHGWALQVVQLFYELHIHLVVVEDNQGGEMIAETIWGVDPEIPIVEIPSSMSKFASALPISSLYTKELIHHVGYFSELEGQMCNITSKDAVDLDDRLDAARIVLGYLLLEHETEPEVVTYEQRHEISRY